MLPRLSVFMLASIAATALAQMAPPRLPDRAARPAMRLMESQQAEKPIRLQALRISSDLSGGLAETTVRMVFFNPNSRPLEGQLQFPLLAGQQITAFALDIDGKMRPAVPVEKAKGRQIFEAIERQKVDPALLEQTEGNNFKLRVYPIAGGGTRMVELKYAEALVKTGSQWSYRLPLAYGERPQDFELTLNVHGSAAAPRVTGALGAISFRRQGSVFQAAVRRSSFAPTGTLAVSVPASPEVQTYVQERGGDTYFVSEIPVSVQRVQRQLPKRVGLLWDSSGSGRTRPLEAEMVELDAYFKALGSAEVRLTRLRDRAEAAVVFQVANGNWDALRAALDATVYDGASALGDWVPQGDIDEYLLVSDGLLNYGSGRFPALAPGQRLYALNSSLAADAGRLAALAERSGGRLVQVDVHRPGAAARTLLTEGAHVRSIKAVGATDILVESMDPAQGLIRVAGKLASPAATLTLTLVAQGRVRDVVIKMPAAPAAHALAAHVWAGYKLQSLQAEFEANRAAIRRLGTEFAMPTRETSLIVLDRLEDYVRYDVPPPADYLADYEQLKMTRGAQRALSREKHLEGVVRDFAQKVAWWEKTYSKERQPKPASIAPPSPVPMSVAPLMAAPPPPPPLLTGSAADSQRASRVPVATPAGAASTGIGIALKKWTSDAPYIARMAAATPDTIYQVYLDEKPSYINSSAFFLDAADMLFDKNQRDLALRVLSNLAEMDLENRHVLRVLGYRLLQAGAPDLAIPVFQTVQRLSEEEPQSFRDLGLAHAAAGHYQQAIDQLNEVVLRPWNSRFAEIELVALAEMNAIIASASRKAIALDTSRIDGRLQKNMPLDLRVVLTWDADNSDMDLWVTDPNDDQSYYGNRFTSQGGRMSRDFTGGYGPEEFSLRDAKPGKYRIEANFFGSSQQIVTGATTLQVKLISGFGTSGAREEMITLRLSGQRRKVFVGEFEVGPK